MIPDYEGGSLREGRPADVTGLAPGARWSRERSARRAESRNAPLLGRELMGRPVMTIGGGNVVHELES